MTNCYDGIIHKIVAHIQIRTLLLYEGSRYHHRSFDRVGHETTYLCMHLVEISIFLLNNVTVRPIEFMNRADKNWANF